MLNTLAKKNILFVIIFIISVNFIGYHESASLDNVAAKTLLSNQSTVNIIENSVPLVSVPSASGKNVKYSAVSEVDLSNVNNGYVMVKYTGTNEKVKIQLLHESEKVTTFDLHSNGEYKSLPITNGSGNYTLTVNENISGVDYKVVHTVHFTADIVNEYEPFLYTNQFINFTADSPVVPLSAELAFTSYSEIDTIESIYYYVSNNIKYDYEKAEVGGTFYMPNVDETLTTQKGICIDYAALTVAMLRSRGIPAKLVVGYAGDVYHSWVSVYTEETGKITDDITFEGSGWVLLDPTLEATGDNLPGFGNFDSNIDKYEELFVL